MSAKKKKETNHQASQKKEMEIDAFQERTHELPVCTKLHTRVGIMQSALNSTDQPWK
jgi:hypothetical protein